jgi:NADH/NAD ratio-sensing transcriptional regulator Rex
MIDPKLDASRQDLAEPLGEVSIPRLYAYHRVLREARAAGEATMTSHGLAALLGHTITSTQIRKDLSALRPLGRRGQGYAIDPLVEQLAWVLGLEHDWRIAIVGFGYLGRAFAAFITARERRFNVGRSSIARRPSSGKPGRGSWFRTSRRWNGCSRKRVVTSR